MKTNKLLIKRINKLLENKSSKYKRKFYILGRLSESKVVENEELLEETVCLIKSLNRTQGDFPAEDYIYSHLEKTFKDSGLSKQKTSKVIKSIKETVSLKFNDIATSKSMILEELGKIKISDAILDKKLENTLIESFYKKISLVKEQEKKPYFVLDDVPEKNDLASLKDTFKKRRDQELSDMSLDDEALTFLEDEEEVEKDYSTKRTSNVEIDKIISRYSDLFDRKNIPMFAKDLKIFLPKDSNWDINTKLNKNDKLYIIMMYRLIKEQEATDSAIRKFLMLDKIRTYLNVRKNFVDDAIIAVGTRNVKGETSKFTSSSTKLPHEKIEDLKRIYNDFTSRIGPEQGQSLSSDILSEDEVISLLFASAGALQDDATDFATYLNKLFPQEKVTETEFEEILGDLELKELEKQNKEFDKKVFDGPDQDDNEYKPEERKPEKVIDIQSSQEESLNVEVIRMSEIDAIEHQKKYTADLNRLSELNKKLEDIYPDIFAPFESDSEGNIIYDGEQEVIPAEGLSDEEIAEDEEILSRISVNRKIEIINLDRRAEIYDQMYERGATPEEFAQFMKSFGLSKEGASQKYSDIARRSYGDFRGTPAARQYALKAWFKGNYYSLNPKEKANLYAQLGERWIESITKLDLVEDEAFTAPGAKPTPNLNKFYSKIPRYLNSKTLESYFDVGNDENLDVQISEKIEQIMKLSDSYEDYIQQIKSLEKNDPLVQKYAVLETMLNGTSGFRIYATTMLKEFYNDYILSQVSSDITLAIRDFYKKYYPGSNIGSSLKPGGRPANVPKEEGRDLFNPIMYLAMSAVGLPKSEVFSQKGDTEENQRKYFLGLINKKGDFAAKVRNYNAALKTGGLYGRESGRYNPVKRLPYGPDDVNLLLDDIFNPGGIIYVAKQKIRNITKDASKEFITFLSGYDQERIDIIVINAMAMSHALRVGVDPMNKEIFEEIGKDTIKAFEKYKKDFAPQLTSESFAEYLGDEYGYQVTNKENRIKRSSATTKNMM